MDRFETERRRRDFSGPIEREAMHNPIIDRCISAYCIGQIVTKEEALSQMVLQMAKVHVAQTDEIIKMASLSAIPYSQALPTKGDR